MNKKGFTLVELLATIVIIVLIGAIATISYTSFMNHASNESFETYRDTMRSEAVNYLMQHYDEVNWVNNTARLTLTDLKIDPINNPKDKNDLCANSYVDVTRSYVGSVLTIRYNACLKCRAFDECKVYGG